MENRVILGDAFAVMPLLPRAFADLLIVDPPYNLDKDFGGSRFGRKSDADYARYTAAWLDAALPLLKPTASVYVCCDWRSGTAVIPVLTQRLNVRNRITWQREKGRGAKANWKNGMEDIWFATVSADYTFNLDAVRLRRRVIAPYKENGQPKDWEQTETGNFRGTCPSNFWDDISIPYWSMAENTAHPTQKPEKLLAKLLLASSNAGDLVFDPFLGSGTTAVAAKKLGRRFVGIEQSRQYCAWAQKRLESAEHDRTIQGYSDGVFWERNSRPGARGNSAAARKTACKTRTP
jgi:site-specific DNA-methyltransferase (adenine-specific)